MSQTIVASTPLVNRKVASTPSFEFVQAERRTVGVLACNYLGMDFDEIRRSLKDARVNAGLTVAELADAMGVDKTTVYRTEDWHRVRDYEPTITTMERWLRATSCESISVFLTRVENAKEIPARATSPVTRERDTVPVAPPPLQPGEASSGHGSIVSGFGVSAAQDAHLLKSLAYAIIGAADALERDGTVRPADAGKTAGRSATAGERGPDDAPNLSRVK